MRSKPKISVNPLATTNSSAANVSPLRSCSTLIRYAVQKGAGLLCFNR